LGLVLNALHPVMPAFRCTNFTAASRPVCPAHGAVGLLATAFLGSSRERLGISEFERCRAESSGVVVAGLEQQGRLAPS